MGEIGTTPVISKGHMSEYHLIFQLLLEEVGDDAGSAVPGPENGELLPDHGPLDLDLHPAMQVANI